LGFEVFPRRRRSGAPLTFSRFHCLLPTACCRLRLPADCLPAADCLLPTAYCLLPTILMRSAIFRITLQILVGALVVVGQPSATPRKLQAEMLILEGDISPIHDPAMIREGSSY
jgi:hypothetical protein